MCHDNMIGGGARNEWPLRVKCVVQGLVVFSLAADRGRFQPPARVHLPW